MMSDSDPPQKKPGVPSWQLPPKDDNVEADSDSNSKKINREAVIEQAKKFLEEDEVKNASTDKKTSFLEGKGLSREEIHGLLGSSTTPEAPASQSTSPSSQISRPTKSTSPPPTPQSQPPPPPTRDVPPIITYPEFLTTSPTPKPLVTRRRLLTTLYLFSGLTALLYGTNNYLVTPMLASLTDSRLSLAETAQQNLQKLISKLEAAVSEIPPTLIGQNGGCEDGEESDEDPAEMFHRDVGTQTSLPSNPPSPKIKFVVSSALDDQTTRLSGLKDKLTSLIEESQSGGLEGDGLSGSISNLRDYLDGLSFTHPGLGIGHGGFSSAGFSVTGGMGSGRQNDADDEISKVKAGIMGVKGVLLSARSFPRGVGVGSRGR